MDIPAASVGDRLDVAETVYRYAVGIDTRDFVLYRSIFADEVAIDFSSYSGAPAATMTADQWVAGLQGLFNGLAATQHSMTNPLAVVDGDRATCRMYMQAHHVFDPDDAASWFTIGGYYDDTLVRDDRGPGGWLLTGVTLTVLWRMGDPAIMVAARAAAAEGAGA
jgi:CubicO group peptidase (beta-lactamase class C family)